MKRVLFKSTLLLSSLSLLLSCAKSKDNNVDQLATLGKATITGKVNARLVDTIGAASVQHAPAGTVLKFWVDTRQFLLYTQDGADYQKTYYSAVVDDAGKFSVTVDVSPYQPETVHFASDSFVAKVFRHTYDSHYHDSIYTMDYTFYPMQKVISVKNNETDSMNVFFN